MYHRFARPADLDNQCRHIRQNYAPVSLAQVDSWLRCGKPLPLNAIAVTVDDGYRDFAEVAYPVFSAWRIPVMVYLVTDFLDGKLWLWVDQVKFAFLRSPLRSMRADVAGGTVLEFSLETQEKRLNAATAACEIFKRLPNRDRLSALASLPEFLKIDIPPAPPAEDAPLPWEEVRRMAEGMASFGAHTRTHPVLSRVSSEDELKGEIEGSKLRIEEMLDRSADHFCYPNGGPGDITPECVEAVRRAHFRTGVTTSKGLNYPSVDGYLLRRIGVEPDLDPEYFQQCAAAFHI